MYSPILTAVALSTVPLYVMMILFIAIIQRMYETSSVWQTQSHLIKHSGDSNGKSSTFRAKFTLEVAGKVFGQISEGFKSVVLVAAQAK